MIKVKFELTDDFDEENEDLSWKDEERARVNLCVA